MEYKLFPNATSDLGMDHVSIFAKLSQMSLIYRSPSSQNNLHYKDAPPPSLPSNKDHQLPGYEDYSSQINATSSLAWFTPLIIIHKTGMKDIPKVTAAYTNLIQAYHKVKHRTKQHITLT